MRRYLGALSSLVSFCTSARAADDWLDEMPSVGVVADVLRQEYNTSADDDGTVANLAGTLILLRQIMEYQAAEEPPMSPERTAKRRSIDTWQQAIRVLPWRRIAGRESRASYVRSAPVATTRPLRQTSRNAEAHTCEVS